LNSLLPLFANNILPILIAAGIGVLLQRLLHPDPRSLSQATMYVLTPCLVFTQLVSSDITMTDMILMVLLAFSLIIIMALLGLGLSRLLRLPPKLTSAFILTIAFMNSGNFGLPFSNYVLGSEGLAWATIFFITSSLSINSLGIYIATAGAFSPRAALRKLISFPPVYAVPLALLVRSFNIPVPDFIWLPLELLGRAAVPIMLLLLGMQIAYNGFPKRKGLVAISASLRLLVSPLIAFGLTLILGLESVAQQSALIEAAMPTAVFSSVLALEFDVEPDFTTGSILVSTLLSPLTLTPLIALLQV
jgi:predicted permease